MKSLIALSALVPSLLFAAPLAISNHKSGDTLRYEVVLLRGTLEGDSLILKNQTSGETIKPLVDEGRFKALVPLKPGANQLTLTAGDVSEKFTLIYQAQTNDHMVRMIWMTDSTGEETFATPDDKMPQDYQARLRTAARLMQTFTAEKMNEAGYGHRTFKLERDASGEITIHKLKGAWPAEHYHKLGGGGEFYQQVHHEVHQAFPDSLTKNIVLAAYTRKDPKTGKLLGHTALGGGKMGLFGSASLFSWPRSIAEAQAAFLKKDTFSDAKVNDDSNFRSAYWAVAATTMGATLHEMGHTFGLYHTGDPRCIMSRGFDYFNRTFTFEDPPSRRNRERFRVTQNQEAYWSPAYAEALKWNRWFSLDRKPYQQTAYPKFKFHEKRGELTISAVSGIRWIGLVAEKDKVEIFRKYEGVAPPKEMVLNLKDFEAELKGRVFAGVDVIDAQGQLSQFRQK